MNDLERIIWTAIREADELFQIDGAGGTKTWMREYLFPSLERHGLKIVRSSTKATMLRPDYSTPPHPDTTKPGRCQIVPVTDDDLAPEA